MGFRGGAGVRAGGALLPGIIEINVMSAAVVTSLHGPGKMGGELCHWKV
jgi:hypothetical protein